jgi:hypothetical protein
MDVQLPQTIDRVSNADQDSLFSLIEEGMPQTAHSRTGGHLSPLPDGVEIDLLQNLGE